MKDTFIFIANTFYLDEEDYCERNDKALIAATSFKNCMSKISDYYGEKNILSVAIDCVSDEYGYCEISNRLYDSFKHTDNLDPVD